MILPLPRVWAIGLLLLAVSNKVLSDNKRRSLDKTGQWYDKDKWLESDAIFIDSDGNHRSDGSGAGVVESDLIDDGSGFGPDDEDADFEGSGDRPTTVFEGSGDVWIDETIRPTVRTPSVDLRPGGSRNFVTETLPPITTTKLPDTTVRRTTPTTTTQEPFVDNLVPTLPPVPEEPPLEPRPDAEVGNALPTEETIYDRKPEKRTLDPFLRPGILAAVIGGAVVGLLAAILLVMFIVYRMRKKDEGSYALDEPKAPPSYSYAYQKAPTKEFYA